VALGGRGLRLADHAVVTEQLGLHGLPDEVHLVTVQGVGCSVLASGSAEQRRRWLPGVAAGRDFASLLLSEKQAGSDLTGITTTATRDGDGHRIDGEKSWNLFADWSTFALCSARTREGENRYDGLSLFIVALDTPGVTVVPEYRAQGDPYFTVTFTDVRVGPEALLGPLHRAWPLLMRAIGFERAGFDYLSRAQRWLRAAQAVLDSRPAAVRSALQPELLRHERAVATARTLAFRTVATADGFDMDEVDSAYSKFACGEAAQQIAWWAAGNLGEVLAGGEVAPELRTQVDVLRRAFAEAPELSVSGGAKELQLDLIATDQRLGGRR
jgi:alkylation response protein AidB-like acyl-CoA dehydrogenase